MTPVKSSNVSHVGHDPATDTLHVRYNNGKLYHYEWVSADEHKALMEADSIGKHLNANIKGKKPFKLIEEKP